MTKTIEIAIADKGVEKLDEVQELSHSTNYVQAISRALAVYHFLLKNRISGNWVWSIDQYDSWNPADSFVGERTFYFSVIQSNTGINPDEIWQKVRPYLQQG